MLDARYLTHRTIQVGNNNGTTSPRGETAEERDEGDTSLDVFVVYIFQQLVAVGLRGRSVLFLVCQVSWLRRADGNYLPHNCRLHHLFEWYIFKWANARKRYTA